jgi:hypothetical protein
MVNIHCPGCHKTFSQTAWSLHLSQTSNPPCRAIYNKQKSYIPGLSDENKLDEYEYELDIEMVSQSPASESSQNVFEGDFFSNEYTDDDFVGWEDTDDDDIDHDQSSSDESSSDDSESSLESDIDHTSESMSSPHLPIDALPIDGPSDQIDDMDDERGRVLTSEEATKVRDSLNVHPVVKQYPSDQAGMPVNGQGSSSIYNSHLGLVHATDGGIYAPFQSKLDWEIARWAKLRGPGSTASSELFSIEGVRAFINSRCD